MGTDKWVQMGMGAISIRDQKAQLCQYIAALNKQARVRDPKDADELQEKIKPLLNVLQDIAAATKLLGFPSDAGANFTLEKGVDYPMFFSDTDLGSDLRQMCDQNQLIIWKGKNNEYIPNSIEIKLKINWLKIRISCLYGWAIPSASELATVVGKVNNGKEPSRQDFPRTVVYVIYGIKKIVTTDFGKVEKELETSYELGITETGTEY